MPVGGLSGRYGWKTIGACRLENNIMALPLLLPTSTESLVRQRDSGGDRGLNCGVAQVLHHGARRGKAKRLAKHK